MKIVKHLFLFLWQLPQMLVAICLVVHYLLKQRIDKTLVYRGRFVLKVKGFRGGLSLGAFLFVDSLQWDMIKHEYGHSRQSKILGWLYLLIVGVPSAILYHTYKDTWKRSYYSFFPEKWADRLGGVNRIY